MRIGVDMYAAENARGSATGTYAQALVRNLTSQFPEHRWLLYRHHGSPDGQLAMERSSGSVDLWLTTMALDPSGTYIPPSVPLEGVPLAGLLSDLAPALVPDRFLQRPSVSERYRRSLLTLPRYDLLLTVCESARVDCLRSFDIDERRVFTIGPAADESFFPADRRQGHDVPRAALETQGIRGPFVLCLAGDDEDRSVAVWTAAVERLSGTVASASQFVIACRLPEQRQAEWRGQFGLKGLADRLLLVEMESDDLRRLLCQHCEALVDASPFEGSGLRLLHALQCGAAAVVDRRSPHVELAGDAATLVDVDQPASLSAKLEQVLGDRQLIDALRQRAVAVARNYSIEAVAKRTMSCFLPSPKRAVGEQESGRAGDCRTLPLSPSPSLPLTIPSSIR